MQKVLHSFSVNAFIISVHKKKIKKMHRPGIGPGPPPWQGEILPLDQRCLCYSKL